MLKSTLVKTYVQVGDGVLVYVCVWEDKEGKKGGVTSAEVTA